MSYRTRYIWNFESRSNRLKFLSDNDYDIFVYYLTRYIHGSVHFKFRSTTLIFSSSPLCMFQLCPTVTDHLSDYSRTNRNSLPVAHVLIFLLSVILHTLRAEGINTFFLLKNELINIFRWFSLILQINYYSLLFFQFAIYRNNRNTPNTFASNTCVAYKYELIHMPFHRYL